MDTQAKRYIEDLNNLTKKADVIEQLHRLMIEKEKHTIPLILTVRKLIEHGLCRDEIVETTNIPSDELDPFISVEYIKRVMPQWKQISNIENGGDGMLSQQEILDVLSKNLNTWREKYGVKRIGLFGSYSREEQTEFSDIDVLVEFNSSDLSFNNYMDLKFELEDRFQKPVDLVILDDIKPALKQSILGNAKITES